MLFFSNLVLRKSFGRWEEKKNSAMIELENMQVTASH